MRMMTLSAAIASVESAMLACTYINRDSIVTCTYALSADSMLLTSQNSLSFKPAWRNSHGYQLDQVFRAYAAR